MRVLLRFIPSLELTRLGCVGMGAAIRAAPAGGCAAGRALQSFLSEDSPASGVAGTGVGAG